MSDLMDQRPEKPAQLAKLREARSTLRTRGYEYEVELAVTRAQHGPGDKIMFPDGRHVKYEDRVKALEEERDRAYRGAARMAEMIEELEAE